MEQPETQQIHHLLEDSNSDNGFVSTTVPLNKVPRTSLKEFKQDKKKHSSKFSRRKTSQSEGNPSEKGGFRWQALPERNVETAPALSVKELSAVTTDAQGKRGSCDHSETEVSSELQLQCDQGLSE